MRNIREIGADPGLKATYFCALFRGLKPPTPSGIAIYDCSTQPETSPFAASGDFFYGGWGFLGAGGVAG
jgi:hypothetical protein